MNKFYGVFLLTISSSIISFAASTNIVGNGTQVVTFNDLQFSGSGISPVNYAAYVEDVASLFVLNSDFTGGQGGVLHALPNLIVQRNGGFGLQFKDVGIITITNSTFYGGVAGQVIAEQSSVMHEVSVVGGDGIKVNKIYFLNYDPGDEHVDILDVMAVGGQGGQITAGNGELDVTGGAGVSAGEIWMKLGNINLIGGAGGAIRSDGSISAVANGGAGLLTGYDVVLELLGDNIIATGGNAGVITDVSGGGIATAIGGRGMDYQGVDLTGVAEFVVDGGFYTGGNGGIVNNLGANALNDVSVTGGDGLYVYAQNLVVSNGVFQGGDGGSVEGLNANSIADGGAGLYAAYNYNIHIIDGNFEGGKAGSVEGTGVASVGAALRVEDSVTVISGGTFKGLGLLMESKFADSSISVFGGIFGDAIFSIDDSFVGTIDVSGGSFHDLSFDGSGLKNINLLNTSYNDLFLGGNGVSEFELYDEVSSSGTVTQSGGTSTINLWSDKHFQNTSISDGVMDFNNRLFTLGAGNSFVLGGQGAAVNFNDDLLLDGGTFDVGLGTLNAPTLVANAGSQFLTTYDGTTNGLVTGDFLTFNEGVTWAIQGGTNAVALGQEFILAEASAAGLINNLLVSDVSYDGTAGSWIEGIQTLENRNDSLVAIYGDSDLDVAVGADPDSEFGKAMSDLANTVGSGDDTYEILKELSEDEAVSMLESGYVRTPEMANTLIQLQGIFANQIKDRTRSYLRGQDWGAVTKSAPQGAFGPGWDSSIDWVNDRLPSADIRGGMKALDEKAPRPQFVEDPKEVKGPTKNSSPQKVAKAHTQKMPREKIEIPTTYQVWGRGYGTYIKQDRLSDFAGYHAQVGGGIIGVDKRFNNLLVGLGGGYAHTSVSGNDDNNGTADTGYGTMYTAVVVGKGYIDANVNYAFNGVETKGARTLGYEGDYDASTVSMYLGGGYGFDLGSILLTTEASLLTTYYNQDAYNETSSQGFATKEWDSYDQWSYLSALGVTLSSIYKMDSFNLELQYQPELRMHWLHEFNADMDAPTYAMVGGVNQIGVALNVREEDLLKVGAGVRFSKWNSDTLEFGLDFDGAFGKDYAAYMFSGKLLHRF